MEEEVVTWLKLHFLPFEGRLRVSLARVCASRAEVDDVIQETYCRVLQSGKLEHVREPRAFLTQIARNIVTDRLRRDALVSIQAYASLDELGIVDETPTPERVATARGELRWVLALAAQLPERCKKVFRARRLHGMSRQETADSLDMNVGLVEYETLRAMDLMSGMVAAAGGGESIAAAPRKARRAATHGDDAC